MEVWGVKGGGNGGVGCEGWWEWRGGGVRVVGGVWLTVDHLSCLYTVLTRHYTLLFITRVAEKLKTICSNDSLPISLSPQ